MLLFVAASIFNINDGVAMTPLMVLFVNFFVCIFPVIVIGQDPGDPDAMRRPPRDPRVTITNPRAVAGWLVYGVVMFVAALVPLVAGPDDLSTDHASASMTMSFMVLGLATIGVGLVCRRETGSGLAAPILPAVKVLAIPTVIMILATELPFLQRGLLTTSLTGAQWLVCIALALAAPAVIEGHKLLRARGVLDAPAAAERGDA